MIEISFGKLIVLALIALIVLGPEKLPGAARTAGALLRRVRNGWDNVRAEVERELEIEEIKRAAREASARADAAQGQLDAALRKVHEPLPHTTPAELERTLAAPAVDGASVDVRIAGALEVNAAAAVSNGGSPASTPSATDAKDSAHSAETAALHVPQESPRDNA